jgi:hypothetical protein
VSNAIVWSIDNPGGAGQHCYLVDKTTNPTQHQIKQNKKRKIGGITFILTFVWHSYCLSALTVLHV